MIVRSRLSIYNSGAQKMGWDWETAGSLRTLSGKPKILLVCDSRERVKEVLGPTVDSVDWVTEENPLRAVTHLAHDQFAGVYITSEYFQEALQIGKFLQNEQILEEMPDAVVLLDGENSILWANSRFIQWSGCECLPGTNFYGALGSLEILGPDFCPFHTALATGQATSSTLRSTDGRFFQVHASPVCEVDPERQAIPPRHLIVTIRDVTNETLQQQKLAAIHQAGMELADLTPDELFQMTVEQRIELLKSNILHYTKDLLHFEVVEVRLLDQKTGRLEPLLSVGMEPGAATRVLWAQPQNNGVTGFVAATGKSYLCEDTTEDPLYLEGARGGEEFADRAAGVARRGNRHVQR